MAKACSRPRTRKGRRKPKWDENPQAARPCWFESSPGHHRLRSAHDFSKPRQIFAVDRLTRRSQNCGVSIRWDGLFSTLLTNTCPPFTRGYGERVLAEHHCCLGCKRNREPDHADYTECTTRR